MNFVSSEVGLEMNEFGSLLENWFDRVGVGIGEREWGGGRVLGWDVWEAGGGTLLPYEIWLDFPVCLSERGGSQTTGC